MWLLDAATELRILCTSREPLGLTGEGVFSLAPLGLPEAGGDVASVVRSDAGRLFVDRAAATDPSFAPTPSTARAVVRICHELDGLPLALELAAARIEHLPPGEIAEGLMRRGRLAGARAEDAPPQHRSMRASLIGATSCSTTPSGGCFGVCRCSPAAGTRRPLGPSRSPRVTERR